MKTGLSWMRRLRQRLDVWRFAARRADYFDYLHAVLAASQGRLTLRELFDRDALRHGLASVRGRLSRRWSARCEAGGGDLHATWRGCFPSDELALVRSAQALGNARLLACFQALAQHLGLLIQARQLVWATLAVAGVALLVLTGLMLAVPLWTAPALQQAFQGLPPAYYGSRAQALFAAAQVLRLWGFALPLGVLLGLAALLCALPRARGRWRRRLDRLGPWRLYRQVQALRFVALMAMLLQEGGGHSTQVRPVLVLLHEDAQPWLAAHLRGMIARVDQGCVGARVFDTGLLDRELVWFLDDMVAARGLQAGLQATHARMRQVWMRRVRREAQAMRWLVLLACVGCAVGLALWHYAVIDDLRRGWMMFQASQ